MRHRNSRRRPYRRFGYYFITTNVSDDFSMLTQFEFGYLLEHILHLSARIHNVILIAYKINPDHVHLIAQIGKTGTISNFMGSWKRQFSRQVNQLLSQSISIDRVNPCDDSNRRMAYMKTFRWQKSYHSHLITSNRDFSNHLNYILRQHEHHGLNDNRHCFVDYDHVFKFE